MSIEKEYIKGIDKLIPRPEIALEVMTLAHEEGCDIASLSAKIKQDPSLTANMLKLANSAYFGHMKEINSITDIIVRLGLDTVKMLAITSASIGLLKTPQDAYNLEPGALWRHSYATALLASIIARYAKCEVISTLYSSALLHDVGKIVLNRPLQVESMNQGEYNQHMPFIEYENAMLHTNHAKTGMALLTQWGLPAAITNPVGCHHDPAMAAKDMSCGIVYLSNYLAESVGIQSEDPENGFYAIEQDVGSADALPDIPGFRENLGDIINEFFEKFNESSTLEFE